MRKLRWNDANILPLETLHCKNVVTSFSSSMTSNYGLSLAISALALLVVSPGMSARAELITIGIYSTENCYPFACFPSDFLELYQQAYSSEAFPRGPIQIESFDIFQDLNFNGDLDEAAYNVYFSTSLNPVGKLSTTFSKNIGPDNTLFGTYMLRGLIQPVTSFTGNRGFTYDPSKGDLLMTVDRLWGYGDDDFDAFFQADNTGSGVFQRMYGIETAWGIDNLGLVTRIHYTPGPLPVVGAGAAFAFSRKLRQRIKTGKCRALRQGE